MNRVLRRTIAYSGWVFITIGLAISAIALTAGIVRAQQCDSSFAAWVKTNLDSSTVAHVKVASILQPVYVPAELGRVPQRVRDSVIVLCKNPPPAPVVTTITVALSATSIQVGQSAAATAAVFDQNGAPIAGQVVAWSSSNTAIATVSTTGGIQALGAGATAITASAVGKTGTANIVVTAVPVPPIPPSGAPNWAIAPELPRVNIDVSMPVVARTVTANTTASLRSALASAQRGDEIVLPAGVTFAGDFVLPAIPGSCSSYITLRTSALSQLPPLGSRIDPAQHAQLMPKIVGQTVVNPLSTALNACGWRLVGIEVTVAANVAVRPDPNRQQGLVYLGNPYTNDTTQQGSDFILDRSYVHGQPNTNLSRCVMLSGKRIAVIGSQLLECHGLAFDSQAIASWRGTGPYLVENNRLEGAGEVILFGGDVAPNGVVASDITVRRNILTRPMSWQGVWTVKNIFELKNARRVLVEENIFENHWCCGQQGPSIMLGTLDNPCIWCIVSDVEFRFNHINNVSGAFNLVDRYGNAQPMVRVRIMNNLVTNVAALGGPQPRCYIIQQAIHDLWIERNSCGAPYAYVVLATPAKTRFIFRANAQTMASQYPWFSSQGQGDASFAQNLAAPYVVDNNLFIANSPSIVPSGNGNVRLATAGAIPAGVGVDQVALMARLQGVR